MYWQIYVISRKWLRAAISGKLIELESQQKNGDNSDPITDSTDSVC